MLKPCSAYESAVLPNVSFSASRLSHLAWSGLYLHSQKGMLKRGGTSASTEVLEFSTVIGCSMSCSNHCLCLQLELRPTGTPVRQKTRTIWD